MEEKLEWFYVLVELPNGESHIEKVCGYSVWHAIDNMYSMKGFSRIQPDRRKYKQHKPKKKSYDAKSIRPKCNGDYWNSFNQIYN